jgi:hypothetical protein
MSRRTRQITTESPLGLRFSENNAAILKFRSPLPPLEMALDIGLFGREMARRSAASAELAEGEELVSNSLRVHQRSAT